MKNLSLVLALMIASSPAFASRARLESLGQDKNGSYFVDDNRNIFLNPAEITNYKKKLWLEYGTTTYTSADNAATNGQAQGGFTNNFGDFTYGLFVGRQSDRLLNIIANTNVAALGNSTNPFGVGYFTTPDHNLDFFFGGEGSVKWGFDLYWAGSQDKTGTLNKTANVLAAKLGVIADKLAVFSTIGISSSSKVVTSTDAADEVKGKLAIDLGATYQMDNMKVKANFSTFGSKIVEDGTSSASGTESVETGVTVMSVGAGWKHELAKSVNMWTITGFDYEKDTATGALIGQTATNAAAIAAGNQTFYNMPLVLAAEAQATSWLTIRGGISHSLFGQNQTSNVAKTSINGKTTVAGGVGMTFGDVQIDGTFGQAAATNSIGYISPATAQAGQKMGFGDNMISRLSLTYNF